MTSPAASVSLLVGASLSLVIALLLLSDHFKAARNTAGPQTSGTVVQREYTYVYGVLRRPKLRIKIEPDGPVVEAVLMVNSSAQIPDNVTFGYSGWPKQEVALEQETSSLVGAALAVAVGLAGIAVWQFSRSRSTART